MSKKSHMLAGVVALVAVAVIITVAFTMRPEGGVRFGAVLPLTGDIAEYGKRCKDGIDLAVEEINKEGGINGEKLEVVYENSEGVPKTGVAAMRKLVDIDHTKVVLGGVASSVTLAIVPIANKNKIILFSPASSSPRLTGVSKYFFRTWPSDVFEATALADFSRATLQCDTVAVLYVNNDYGLGLKGEFVRRFTELGGQVPEVQIYDQGATDFRTQLTKIKSISPDAVYLAGYHREMAHATKQIRELGITAQILGDADYGVEELLAIAGDAAEGAVYSTPEYNPKTGSGAAQAFAKKFKSKFGREPSVFEANAYDAVKITASAMAMYGEDTDDIAARISSLKDYPGASGDIAFGRNGEVEKPAAIKTVRKGVFVYYADEVK